jgi:hypothetical protein
MSNSVIVSGQENLFSRDGFELIQRMAKAFSTSSLVPKHYQGANGIGNCIIALNMAQRIGSDPLMTMQNLYVVHGTPSWSSQFLIATFNTSGRFSSIRFEWTGTEGKDDWGCRAMATERETGEVLRGTLVTIAIAKAEGWHGKAGSKWKTMPEQMLMYRSAAWFVRAYAPEIAMGLHTIEELEDCGTLQRNGSKVTTIDIPGITGALEDTTDEPSGHEASADDTGAEDTPKEGLFDDEANAGQSAGGH